jgi:hypothetical protein
MAPTRYEREILDGPVANWLVDRRRKAVATEKLRAKIEAAGLKPRAAQPLFCRVPERPENPAVTALLAWVHPGAFLRHYNGESIQVDSIEREDIRFRPQCHGGAYHVWPLDEVVKWQVGAPRLRYERV